MPLSNYRIQADWGRDLGFDHAQSDLTDDVIAVQYTYGLTQPFEEVAPPSQMVVTLNNGDGKYFVEDAGSPLYNVFRKGVLVRLQRLVSGNWRTVYVGTLEVLQVTPTVNPPKIAQITVGDPMRALEDAEYLPPLQIGVSTGEALTTLFESGVVVHPYPHLYWMVGIPGSSEVGTTTRVFEVEILDADNGHTLLAQVGDNADEGFGVSAAGFLRDVVASELGGRFFFNPKAHANAFGTFEFWDRYHLSGLATAIDISAIAQEEAPPVYRVGDDIINHVEINYEPRVIGGAGSVLYTQTSAASLAPGQGRTFVAHYRDLDVQSARVGGMDMIDPIPTIDYTANSAQDGSGTDLTASLGVAIRFDGGSAEVTLFNNATIPLYVTHFQLRGTPITSFQRETATASDGQSIADYGLHKRVLNINFLGYNEQAQIYAQALLGRFKTPIGRVERVTLRNATLLDQPSLMGLGVVCDLPGVSSGETRYVIMGVEHLLDATTGDDLLTLVLEPLQRLTYWVLGIAGQSEVGVTTKVGF